MVASAALVAVVVSVPPAARRVLLRAQRLAQQALVQWALALARARAQVAVLAARVLVLQAPARVARLQHLPSPRW